MFSPADDTRATLLGFLIRDVDADDDVLLTVQPGLSVLYGLNGAGKSRTLGDIRRFWRGVSSESLALIRAPRPAGDIDWYTETDRADWYPDWARRAGVSVKFEDDILHAWLRACLEADEVSLPGETSRPDRLAELMDEWFEERLLLVQSVGSEGDGQWVSAPAFLTGPGFTATNAEIGLFEAVAGQDAWVDHGAECYLTPFGKTPDGRTISCASLLGTPAIDKSQWYFSAGRHDRLIDLSTRLFDPEENVDERTRTHLMREVRDLVTVSEGSVRPSEQLVDRVRQLEKLANTEFSGVLQDAPVLRLHVEPIGLGPRVEWFVQGDGLSEDPAGEAGISVDAEGRTRSLRGLSTAQRRWALWSIAMAVRAVEVGETNGSRLILVDEPEAALHRSAEARMADYLSKLVGDGFTQILAATHSPELLDLNGARVYEVSRQRSRRKLSPLTSVARENMHDLGLMPSDLLRRQRGFILVEGQHDEIVLGALFGDVLRKLQVEVLPMRGTHQLSPAKIAFLFSYTPGHIFIMLDNIVTSELSDTWERAIHHFRAGLHDEAIAELTAADCLRSPEGKKLREVLQHALVASQAERITPHGLSCADIIEYLPVRALVPGEEKWSELRERHRKARADSPGTTAKDFKIWLRESYRADFGPEAMRSATECLDVPPPDLLRLLKVVEAHVTEWHSQLG